jgi:hypothetical protein
VNPPCRREAERECDPWTALVLLLSAFLHT